MIGLASSIFFLKTRNFWPQGSSQPPAHVAGVEAFMIFVVSAEILYSLRGGHNSCFLTSPGILFGLSAAVLWCWCQPLKQSVWTRFYLEELGIFTLNCLLTWTKTNFGSYAAEHLSSVFVLPGTFQLAEGSNTYWERKKMWGENGKAAVLQNPSQMLFLTGNGRTSYLFWRRSGSTSFFLSSELPPIRESQISQGTELWTGISCRKRCRYLMRNAGCFPKIMFCGMDT